MIADDRVLDPIGESQTEITTEAVVTRIYVNKSNSHLNV